jgi:phage/plasmid-like protein (TIGR03299 family)
MLPAENKKFLVRQDNGHVLGLASDQYQVVQPGDVLEWFEKYISVDDRFHLDAAGVLHGGEQLWATARFNGDLMVAGDKHTARLLMSTSYDLSKPTINQATTERAVCNNTLNVAWADKRAVIRTSHRTRFDGDSVHRELGQIAQSFATYKAMGDAMAQTSMAMDEVSRFFKGVLDIPVEAKKEDISTRKLNQFDDLKRAWNVTRRERNDSGKPETDVWSALQAVTRYVDHDRAVKSGEMGEEVSRFAAAQFGSGDALKGKAMGILMPLIRDKVLIPA